MDLFSCIIYNRKVSSHIKIRDKFNLINRLPIFFPHTFKYIFVVHSLSRWKHKNILTNLKIKIKTCFQIGVEVEERKILQNIWSNPLISRIEMTCLKNIFTLCSDDFRNVKIIWNYCFLRFDCHVQWWSFFILRDGFEFQVLDRNSDLITTNVFSRQNMDYKLLSGGRQ